MKSGHISSPAMRAANNDNTLGDVEALPPEVAGALKRWLSEALSTPIDALVLPRGRFQGTVHRHQLVQAWSGEQLVERVILRRAQTPAFPACHDLREQAVMSQQFANSSVNVATCFGLFLPASHRAMVSRYHDGPSRGVDVVALGQNNSLARKLGTELRLIHQAIFDRAAVSGPLPTWQDQADAFLAALPSQHPLAPRARAAFQSACIEIADLCGDSVPLHGDYRSGNYIIGGEGRPIIMDFDLVHLGDPRMDCAWFLSPSWRYGSDQLIAGGVGSIGAFIAGYGPIAEDAYTPPWQRYALSRWAVMALIQADRGARANREDWRAEALEAEKALRLFDAL